MSDGVKLSKLLQFVYDKSNFKCIIDSYLNIKKIIKLINDLECNSIPIYSYKDFLKQFDLCYSFIENKLSIDEKNCLVKYKSDLFSNVYDVFIDNDESSSDDDLF